MILEVSMDLVATAVIYTTRLSLSSVHRHIRRQEDGTPVPLSVRFDDRTTSVPPSL